jgi:protein-disulfide isomerase
VITDSSALVIAALAVVARRHAPPAGAAHGTSLAALGLAAAFLPVGLASAPPPPPRPVVIAGADLPPIIAREQRPGVATIVEFLDFECPFCRRLNATLEPILAEYGAKVRVVRKMVPLVRLHPHALPAALAYCCADEVGRAEAMAQALFTTDDLSAAGCERTARSLGLDLPAFQACVADARTQARIEADVADAVGLLGGRLSLPTIWIGGQMHSGLVDAAKLRASIDSALANSGAGSGASSGAGTDSGSGS